MVAAVRIETIWTTCGEGRRTVWPCRPPRGLVSASRIPFKRRLVRGDAVLSPRSHQRWVLPLACAAVLACCGCLGPRAVQCTRARYNEVIQNTNNEELLLNLVRLRY